MLKKAVFVLMLALFAVGCDESPETPPSEECQECVDWAPCNRAAIALAGQVELLEDELTGGSDATRIGELVSEAADRAAAWQSCFDDMNE